jgi:eukaryotic-like serine/threonine-protein kinase
MLLAGTRLGPYEIVAPIGAGGMGEVYRARDTRLNREVAVKVLGEGLVNDPDRRARFEKEAHAVAARNHPNIVSLFDIGTEGAVLYTVSELVEGESLRSLLVRGPVPLRKLIDIAVQLAGGMAAAHAAGITHRDLKPENIMVATDGQVKILDFGLARQAAGGLAASSSALGTVTIHQTEPGTIMGTANYMSPEQARGEPVDYRSDQFSFGLILYELASGNRAFQKDSSVQTLAAIIGEEPPPIDVKLPPPLRWAIDRCLAKEAAQRYESTLDLYREIQSLRDHLSEAFTTGTMAPVKTAAPPQFRWKLVAAALFVLLVGCVWFLVMGRGVPDFSEYRFTPFAMGPEGQGNPIWSPDGKGVVYAGRVSGQAQVFLRYLNSSVSTQLTKTKDWAFPVAWSSDGKRLFFLSKNPSGPADALFSVAAVGGEPELIMPVEPNNTYAFSVSPDGRTVAEFRPDETGLFGVMISSPAGSPFRKYSPTPFAGKDVFNKPVLHFSPDGTRLLLLRAGDQGREEAWLVPYPEGRGTPRLVLKNIPRAGGTPTFSWMPDSRHIVISVMRNQETPPHLWIADTESDEVRPLTSGTSVETQPAVSPDGRKILYTEGIFDENIVSVSLDDGALRNLIATDRSESMPAWAARAAKLAYVTNRDGPLQIWLRDPDGSDRPIVTGNDFPGESTKWFMDPSLSAEGDRIVFTRIDAAGACQMWIQSLSGGAPVRLTKSPDAAEFAGSWSPDGTRLAYFQVSLGKTALMIVKAGSQATPIKLKEDIDDLPEWSPTGEWIAYEDKDGWALISPDGHDSRTIGKIDTQHLTFSKDGKRLYGIRAEGEHQFLFSMDLATLQVKTIRDLGQDAAPRSGVNPGIRFSVAPDGKSFVYTVAKSKSNIWLFEGFAKTGWLRGAN